MGHSAGGHAAAMIGADSEIARHLAGIVPVSGAAKKTRKGKASA